MVPALQDPRRDVAESLPKPELPDPAGGSSVSFELVAAGDAEVVTGDPPVPIAVWRVADAVAGDVDANALTPSMVALLVASYSRPGDTVVSIGHDPALAGAAGAGGRAYLHVPDHDHLAELDHVAGTVALIVLPWPPEPRSVGVSRDALQAMFGVCRRLMRRDGCTIVAFTAVADGDSRYARHAGPLVPAARHAGLDRLRHIVAVIAPAAGRHLVWRAAPADPLSPQGDAVAVYIDLLVFTVRRGHRV